MPLYRIRGLVSFDRDETPETDHIPDIIALTKDSETSPEEQQSPERVMVHYENQALDAEAEGASPQDALRSAEAHLAAQRITNILHTDGPRFYQWFSHELGQGWTEVTNG